VRSSIDFGKVMLVPVVKLPKRSPSDILTTDKR
jgi:hypothetical protein